MAISRWIERNLPCEAATATARIFLSPDIFIKNLLETLLPMFGVFICFPGEANLLHWLEIAESSDWKWYQDPELNSTLVTQTGGPRLAPGSRTCSPALCCRFLPIVFWIRELFSVVFSWNAKKGIMNCISYFLYWARTSSFIDCSGSVLSSSVLIVES